MTKAERAIDLIGQIEKDTRDRILKDIIGDLQDHFLPNPTNDGEYPDTARGGVQSAIDYLKSNY
jgi:hypothetical protein